MSRSPKQLDADAAGPERVLVVDDHASARDSIAEVLEQAGYEVATCASAAAALQRLVRQGVDVIVTDLQMPGMNGLEFLAEIERRRVEAQVLMITAHGSVAIAVDAMRQGAFDFIEKPFDAARLEQSVAQACLRRKLMAGGERSALRKGAASFATSQAGALSAAPVMIGSSRAMQDLRDRIARVAATDETVLICGESGTGKELVAHAIHAGSNRRNGPLVSLNCPALSEQLTESELFGHRRGAFTGAEADHKGRFELADRGTIVLDEVTEINLHSQAKLLRVLQERSFERVGANETISVDVRVIAITNRMLSAEVEAGRFREDLYYRLAVVPIVLPPLRERGRDTLELINHYIRDAAVRLGREPCILEPAAESLLTEYHWPGNIRELRNIITRACVLSQGERILADEIRPWLRDTNGSPSDSASGGRASAEVPVGLTLEEVERQMIVATLEQYDGHRQKTADALGIGVRTLSGKLRSYGFAPGEKDFAKAE